MPISPKEADRIDELDECAIENIQSIIDEQLLEVYDRKEVVIDISKSIYAGLILKQRVIDIIVNNYKAVGWKQVYFKNHNKSVYLSPNEPKDAWGR